MLILFSQNLREDLHNFTVPRSLVDTLLKSVAEMKERFDQAPPSDQTSAVDLRRKVMEDWRASMHAVDWKHLSLSKQREMWSRITSECLRRLARAVSGQAAGRLEGRRTPLDEAQSLLVEEKPLFRKITLHTPNWSDIVIRSERERPTIKYIYRVFARYYEDRGQARAEEAFEQRIREMKAQRKMKTEKLERARGQQHQADDASRELWEAMVAEESRENEATPGSRRKGPRLSPQQVRLLEEYASELARSGGRA